MPVDLIKHPVPFDPAEFDKAVKVINRMINASLAGLRARSAFGLVLQGQPQAARTLLALLPPEMLPKVRDAATTLAAEAQYVIDQKGT